MRWRLLLALACLLIATTSAGDSISELIPPVAETPANQSSRALLAKFSQLPIAFEEYVGPSSVFSFLARGPGYRVLLKSDQARIALRHARTEAHGRTPSPLASGVDLLFLGAAPHARGHGFEQLEGKTNYITSDAENSRTAIANFAKVRFAEVYPGIDIVYYGTQRQLEFDLVVAPGAVPASVRFAVVGAETVAVDQSGDLRLGLGSEEIVLHRPRAYQETEFGREDIQANFLLNEGNVISLQVGAFDHRRTLTIDPLLSYATYLGGGGDDTGTAIAIDASGNAYVAGFTNSKDFPFVAPYDRSLGRGDTDVFVTKLNSSGTAFIYSTYLGDSGGVDKATGIAVDSAGNAYVTGVTTSSDFPTTTGAYQLGATGGGSFVAKLGTAGNTLVYSTYVLGATAAGIAVDGSGNAFITGRATSTFATTAGAFQPTTHNTAGTNAFVLKLNSTGTAALYATFLGGSGNDIGNGIAIDGQGSAYIGGSAASSNFPVVNALQSTLSGGKDGFITKLNASGAGLIYSTYLGGTLDDSVNAIAVDTSGNAYVAGETYSSNFPVRNAFQPVKAGYRLTNSSLGNAFVTKLDATGSNIAYSSFLGGEICTSSCYTTYGPQYPGDAAYAIAVDSLGHAYVGGIASSYTFPLVDSLLPEKTQDNMESAFVTKVGRGGAVPLYSTFIRTGICCAGSSPTGVPLHAATGVAADSTGAAFATGDAWVGELQATAGTAQATGRGLNDGIVVKLSGSPATLALSSSANPVDVQVAVTLTATVSGGSLSGSVIFMDGRFPIGSAVINGGTAVLTKTLPIGIHAVTAIFRGNGADIDSPLLYQVVDNPLVCN